MRKVIAAFTAISFLLLPVTANAAAPKAGAKCTKLNQSQSVDGSRFTCVKSGLKLVWKKVGITQLPSEAKPVDFSKTYSTDDGYLTLFSSPCDRESNIPADLAELQSYFYGFSRCAGQLQLGKYLLGIKRPKLAFDTASKFANLEPCKVSDPPGKWSGLGHISFNSFQMGRRYPAPTTVIQLIPIYSSDTAKPSSTPAKDYKLFLDYFRNWIEYSSDFGSNVKVRVPESYIKMNSPVGSFQLKHPVNWDTPGHVQFNRELVASVDPVIDFTGANIGIVVPPPGTEAYIFAQAAIGTLATNEGIVTNVMTEYGAFAKNPTSNTYAGLAHPFWWIHEIMHSGIGLDDHYGDTRNDLKSEYGMGHLTMMTPWGGDLSTWEKWKLGFIKDSQIQCKSDSGTSTHWIAPSTVQTQESKSVIISISHSKAIIIESLRPGGLFYKHPLQSQGALVYEIDLSKTDHGMGMKISLPIGRSVESTQVFMASAPLKQGESTISNGFKITVVESGTFGDVIKVEKQ